MTYDDFLKRLKEARCAKKISLKQIAALLGVTPSHISAIENGRTPLKVIHLLKICDFLEIPPSFLIDEAPAQKYISAAKKLESLPQREFLIINNLIMLMQLPPNGL